MNTTQAKCPRTLTVVPPPPVASIRKPWPSQHFGFVRGGRRQLKGIFPRVLGGHAVLRRSTIEIHPKFSEAPHSRSSIPHPKTGLQQKSNCIAVNNPMAQVYTKRLFSTSRLTFRRFGGKGIPSFRNKIAEMCYLYRRTGILPTYTVNRTLNKISQTNIYVLTGMFHHTHHTSCVPYFGLFVCDRLFHF